MLLFFMTDAVEAHRDYLRTLKLKYSILEKSIDGIAGKPLSEIRLKRLNAKDREDVVALYTEIKLHEIYFSSFSDRKFPTSSFVREKYGSESALLNHIYKKALALPFGFVSLNVCAGEILVNASTENSEHFKLGEPSLALDLAEHAYFRDYGFEKERYIIDALEHLDLSRLVK